MGDSNGTEAQGGSLPSGTIAKLTRDILNETFYNIIYDIVAQVHHDEKVARMRSAVVAARQKAEEEAVRRREETGNKAAGASKPGEAESEDLKGIHAETDAAVFDDGKVFLKGNPLHTTKEIICPDCRLPRLLYPVTGIGARQPPDPYREYCQKQPMISKPGHDVHGNPFATDKLNPKKKKQTNTANTPASSPPTTPDSSFNKAAPEKVSFPTVKCPNCPRYFVVTRVAQHLDRCLGLSGRPNRNKTPMENGSSTSSTAPSKRPLADEDAPSTLPKKKKLMQKKLSGKKPPLPPSSKLRNGLTPDMVAAADAGSGDGDIKSEAKD
ncbi:SGF11 family protein [Aspergillus clavatus NRRL 1]|uniref:SAGA-associated factor 11 n=1 Tax=Aspergillus clavatus (strain ATCC 1007 / CBS 513.65 / DSM 816 / NCTC 3887 / NRRL 1 / QM 1276 / 107) TaxID=344612 RepID=A1CMU8_ASPCL|nr:transcriptional activator (PtaC), putative [Aspergillus clavatus NRRL 1]EAW08885.1 transcriptional activator (PtaC), putative [Aspergillus clavatus NRRL 1]